MIPIPADFNLQNNASKLVLLLHASGSSTDALKSVEDVISKTEPTPAILCPPLPAGTFSFVHPDNIVIDLLEMVDQVWAARTQPYEEIIFVGHSLGALLARKLYIYACGENCDAPFGLATDLKEPREWAEAVDRIILLAGMNRGWTISHNLPLSKAISFRLGAAYGYCCMAIGKTPQLMHIRRGAPFITQLRIQWLSMRRHQEKKPGNAVVIQLLGSVDDIVGPEDNLDMVTGKDFYYFDVPMSGHGSIIEMDDSIPGRARRDAFSPVFSAHPDCLAKDQILPVDASLMPSEALRKEVTDVVFVIHGIRDRGFWTHKIARRVLELCQSENSGDSTNGTSADETKRSETSFAVEIPSSQTNSMPGSSPDEEGGSADKQPKFATETSSYGYFPMLPFTLPWTRRAKVEWFMDQYTENLAYYPEADFSFVGHSNGTYLLANALERYPSCHFKNVVFAGSVVRTDYRWDKLLKKERIQNVLNYVATGDWVVALFPKGFQALNILNLGGAGFDGFAKGFLNIQMPTQPSDAEGARAMQIEYVSGAHSAALQEQHWGDIAHFIVHGKLNNSEHAGQEFFQIERKKWVLEWSQWFWALWLLILLLVIGAGLIIWFWTPWSEWFRTLALVFLASLVWTAVTKL